MRHWDCGKERRVGDQGRGLWFPCCWCRSLGCFPLVDDMEVTMFFGEPPWSFMSHPSGLGPVVTNVARLQSELDFLLKLETRKSFLYLLAFLARGWAIR